MVAETQFLFSAFLLPPESDFVDTAPASFSPEELGKSSFPPFSPLPEFLARTTRFQRESGWKVAGEDQETNLCAGSSLWNWPPHATALCLVGAF